MADAPLICFEGPIAAGKTTLASKLSAYTGYGLVLERFDENPFLTDFYANEGRWALPMQLWFLAERDAHVLQTMDNSSSPLVADFSSAKNDVFARTLLVGREFALYSALSARLRRLRRQPDLVVLLDADDAVLLQRIAQRGREYERHIDSAYLGRLRDGYETFFDEAGTHVLRFDNSSLDIGSEEQVSDFARRVLRTLVR